MCKGIVLWGNNRYHSMKQDLASCRFVVIITGEILYMLSYHEDREARTMWFPYIRFLTRNRGKSLTGAIKIQYIHGNGIYLYFYVVGNLKYE